MLILAVLAFGAGVLTIVAPCILPVVPLVFGAASTGGRRRSFGILAGFGGAFLVVTVVLASSLAAAGLTMDGMRAASALFLGLVGLAIALPAVGYRVGRRLAPATRLGAWLSERQLGDGTLGGLVLGVAIGLVWAPCVGPVMAGVIVASAVRGPTADAVVIAGAYVLGTVIPLAVIAGLGRRAGAAAVGRDASRHNARIGGVVGWVRPLAGLAMLLGAILVVTGLDLRAGAAVADLVQVGPVTFAANEAGDLEPADPSAAGRALPIDPLLPPSVATTLPGPLALDDLGPAPDFAGIQAWLNSDPVTISALRGKVVLVEFWTFACVNCIHVQPYVNAWFDRYADAGLVVIGVHSPELSFEREIDNVRTAVRDRGIRYPIAIDPAFATWNAYRNAYWPALYFVDRMGRIRHMHAGEGDYAGSEQVIRQLLAGPG